MTREGLVDSEMKKKAFAYIILAGILWGTSGLFVAALAPRGFTSMQMTAMRGCVSLICFLIYALIFDRSALRARPAELLLLAGSGLSLFGTAFCYYTSMQMTSVSTAVVLMYTAPIFVTVFSVIFMGERMTALKAVSIGMMVVGCCLVSGIVGGFAFDPLGILIGLASGICYSSYNILTKIEMKKGIKPTTATTYNFAVMAAVSLAICDPVDMVLGMTSFSSVALAIGIGVVTTVLPYLFYTLAMRELPAGTASSLGIVEPLAATLFGILLLSQVPDIFAFIGIALIVVAVFMLGKAEDGASRAKVKGENSGEK